VDARSIVTRKMDDDWLDGLVPVHPLLRDPLFAASDRLPRRLLGKLVLEALGLGGRVGYDHHRDRVAVLSRPTYEAILKVVPWLTQALDAHTLDLIRMSQSAAGHSTPQLDDVAGVLLDLGWGHVPTAGGSVIEVLDGLSRTWRLQMQPRLLRLLRCWEARGFVVDAPSVNA